MTDTERFWTCEAAPVLRALDAGQSPVLVSGVGAASRAHMAAAARRMLGAPLVVVCPDDVAAETRRQIEAIVEQSNPNEVYDADRHYLPEVTERAYLAALDAVLAHAEKFYAEDELTLSLTYTDGRWQMLMSPELLRALGGGTGA